MDEQQSSATAASAEPSNEARCGNCRWHFDLVGKSESAGWKHCLARPYPDCTLMLSEVTARCDMPGCFAPPQVS